MKRSEQINELASALSKFQGQVKNAEKDSVNYFKQGYTTLASAWDAIRKPLSDNGLCVVQDISANDPKVIVTSLLMHASGQWIESSIEFLPKDMTPQSVASCLSYGRRYLLMSQTGVAGMAEEDDDAESATNHKLPSKPEKSPIEFAQGEEKPECTKTEPVGYFSKIMSYLNTSTLSTDDRVKIVKEAKDNRPNENALKEIYDRITKE